MKMIINIYEKVVEGDKKYIRADIMLSTADMLDGLATIDEYTLMPGTIAFIVQTGAFYTLDENGKWYNADGTGEYTE